MRSSILNFVETSDDWNNRVTKDAAAVTEKKRMFEEGIENGSIKKPKKGIFSLLQFQVRCCWPIQFATNRVVEN